METNNNVEKTVKEDPITSYISTTIDELMDFDPTEQRKIIEGIEKGLLDRYTSLANEHRANLEQAEKAMIIVSSPGSIDVKSEQWNIQV